jgi:putative membrane protein insertion efficiency factor
MLKFIALALLRFYKFAISPWIGNHCRFAPSCSLYMIDAIEKKGVFKGIHLGVKRILRCHPWGGSGYDPVPILLLVILSTNLHAKEKEAPKNIAYLQAYIKAKMETLALCTDALCLESQNDLLKSVLYNHLQADSKSFFYADLKGLGLHVLDSPDKQLRIVSWGLNYPNGEQYYYGYILHKKSEQYALWELQSLSPKERFWKESLEKKPLDWGHWYGAIYTEIVPFQVAGKKHYALLGIDPIGEQNSRKIIDILHFQADGSPTFGDALLHLDAETSKHRLFFEYMRGAHFNLRYEKKLNAIILDVLKPWEEDNTDLGVMLPNGDFALFVLQKKGWYFLPIWDGNLKTYKTLVAEIPQKFKPVQKHVLPTIIKSKKSPKAI